MERWRNARERAVLRDREDCKQSGQQQGSTVYKAALYCRVVISLDELVEQNEVGDGVQSRVRCCVMDSLPSD